ncbi:DUF6924 domain-containing protein [Blastopirellula marina]|uniref:DUF6924 domain-containing protein n=1 Tax=Blastopirellula marina TaxID=124 RepID=A0A2S8F4D3_9BACT|nr:hypothetical protein [Blastopirellula marina]PQO27016.1 hypothetical protein C5Y98_27550 [Blastopirellula marina]PTL41163.1 hypothetical protein C5Y97_27565 [Blastopirellula marina]
MLGGTLLSLLVAMCGCFEPKFESPQLVAQPAAKQQTETETPGPETPEPGLEPTMPAEAPIEEPKSQDAIIYRTDFTDATPGWDEVVKLINTPTPDGFRAYVQYVEDKANQEATVDQLLAKAKKDNLPFFFVIDAETIDKEEHPVLVVDASEEPGRTFRVIPSEMWGVENNLSVANMDWEDFADHLDDDGVYRGF